MHPPPDAPSSTPALSALDVALLNNWQRDFPITAQPFEVIAGQHGTTSTDVLQRYQALMNMGALSRIGGIFGVGAGGSAMLCALAVPPEHLSRVAAQVNAFDYVNHNYAREHHWNLWFVVTAPSADERDQCIRDIELVTQLRALRLPMRRAFRIDLGFDLHSGPRCLPGHQRCAPIDAEHHALAAAIEQGMPLVDRPYAAWAREAGSTEEAVMQRVMAWTQAGVLRRLGVIVRHHELGVTANAMTVFNVPDEQLVEMGLVLAQQGGITLCYARHRDEGWPYNLYCMVHGRSREETRQHIEAARRQTGLDQFDHAVLFSTERFKQTGGRYFRPAGALMEVAA
ncbi:MAG: Lrp/AsnC family transcriptional regulator [Burkholderiales bacterium]|nr:Lrp/AsnC family transcriptional regulator [Burkholderiales bacterium]